MSRQGSRFSRTPGTRSRPSLPAARVGEYEAKRILAAAGFPVVDERLVRSPAEAAAAARALGDRLVLKILSPHIRHKTEIRGVLLDVPASEAAGAYNRLVAEVGAHVPLARIEGVLISPMLRDGVETIIGVQERPGLWPGRDVRARWHLRRGAGRRDLPHGTLRGSRGAPYDWRDQGLTRARRCARPPPPMSRP